MIRQLLYGAACGAAGTTALNAATYADMALRARPASSTPQQTVEQLAQTANVRIPGEGEAHDNRVSALGSMTGLVTGVGVGAVYGLARAIGIRPPTWAAALIVAAGAMAGSNGPMTVLGVTDPRSWSATEWISDVVPHLAYGAVTAATYARGER